MASRSGEVDMAEGETTERETTEFTDLSTESDSGTPQKLKAEILATADSTANEDEEEEEDDGEEEEEDEEEEEEDDEEEEKKRQVDSCESDQEWDVDSFKDEDFHSSDVSDDEDLRRYVRQCYESEGFDVPLEFLPRRSTRIYSGFNPVDLDDFFKAPYSTGREYMETVLKVVIEKYNEDKKKNLVLDQIVRAVVKMGVGVKSYITFMARESPEGKPVEYQGKAEWKVWQRNIHPILCRPASEQKKNCANLCTTCCRGVLHRDIKGANLLIDSNGVLKIADFGLATFFDPAKTVPLTSHVVTLWYRPPELLLGASHYGGGVDLWSTGCILGELYAGKPTLSTYELLPYRPQPSWDRTCTAAAAIALLSELSLLPQLSSHGLDKQADALEEALVMLLDSLTGRRLRMGRSITRKVRNTISIC